jgi:LuxR family transcriptional regulator, maltose regulon positive regulatory protein
MTPYQPKIIPPRLRDVTSRERLFNILDGLAEFPVTWVSAPAGSGKTTLVASYVQARKIPIIWYRVDEADNDIASFFFYMGEAAKWLKKKRTKPLPLFTPEYHLGLTTFSRNYFNSLFLNMPRPGVIVLDNYQDVDEGSEIHDVLRNGLKEVPEGIRVLIASRKRYPPSFVSLKAGSMLASLDWERIRFTVDEVRDMVLLRKKKAVPDEAIERIHRKAKGWAAAIVLMMDEQASSLPAQSTGHSAVFDYLAVEVFRGLDEPIKDFLVTTSFLPVITPEIVAKVTGIPESPRILERLSRNHYFTDLYGTGYRYHPLFREFLLAVAEKKLGTEQRRALQRKAGVVLLESGQVEEAVSLLARGAHWDTLIPAIVGQAQTLIGDGRGKTLEQWIEYVPEKMRSQTPWLLYWSGMCRLPYDPVASRLLFDEAFSLFEKDGDATGSLLAWCGGVSSIAFEYRDLWLLDERIEWLDAYMKDALAPFPSSEVECIVASAMVFALMVHRPYHKDFEAWIKRTPTFSAIMTSPSIRVQVFQLPTLFLYMWLGDYPRWAMVVEEMESMTKLEEPFSLIWWLATKASFLNETRPLQESSLILIEKGLQLSAESGIHLIIAYLTAEGVQASLTKNDLLRASKFLKDLEAMLQGAPNMIRMRYHAASGLYHLLAGDAPGAIFHEEELLKLAKETGGFFPEATAHLYLAFTLFETDRQEDARSHIAAYRAMPETPSLILEYTCLLAEAALALKEGSSGALNILRKALNLGKKQGYVSPFYWWQPSLMIRLCKAALTADIEVDHVKHIIRSRNLIPDEPPSQADAWPWPYKIRTLGTFEIMVNDEPLTFTGKVQKRPLSLLKAIIALGGKDVREDALEDLIWPEAEGDAAPIAFRTTLSRLRKLLGSEEAIKVREGKVSLNDRLVWVDLWALENVIDHLSTPAPQNKKGNFLERTKEAARLMGQLYRGDFLKSDDDPWIGQPRDRLRKRYLRTINRASHIFLAAGEIEAASALHEQAAGAGLDPDETRSLNSHIVRPARSQG